MKPTRFDEKTHEGKLWILWRFSKGWIPVKGQGDWNASTDRFCRPGEPCRPNWATSENPWSYGFPVAKEEYFQYLPADLVLIATNEFGEIAP